MTETDRPRSLLAPAHGELRTTAHALIDRVLERQSALVDAAALCTADQPTLDRLRAQVPTPDGRPLDEVMRMLEQDVLTHAARMDHPTFHGFIPSPASPLSWLADIAVSGYNPHAGSWLQSSGPSQVERDLIAWLAAQFGLPAGAGGLFVSGGSMANLTAMAAARDDRLKIDERARGVAYVSDQTHSSITKGLRLLGFDAAQVRAIPSDGGFRLDPAALREAIRKDQTAGLLPFLIVASAGTTNTGSIDPLPVLAHISRQTGAWLHVDGAFGAAVALCAEHRTLLAGLESADSVSFDPHKWGFQTYDCACVVLRDANLLRHSFGNQAEYLRDAESADEQPNFWDLGPELTRPARALKFWFTIQVMGTQRLSAAIARGFELSAYAQSRLERLPALRIVSPAQLGIVCFRFEPPGLDATDCDLLNARIARAMIADGRSIVLATQLRGCTCLRIVTIHPDTCLSALDFTISELARHCESGQANLLASQ